MARLLIQETTFEVHAKHIRGQGRPRFTKTGHAYKADEDKAWEKVIRDAYYSSCPYKDMAGFADAVCISVEVQRWLPKSSPADIKEAPDTLRPDCSNIQKSVEDALNKVAYRDDSQIVRCKCAKLPRKRPEDAFGNWEERDEVMRVIIEYLAKGDIR